MLRSGLAALCISLAFGQGSDRIQNLPGWAGSQAMYAGYINVNTSHGRNLFYWLVESAGNPATDPLVLCASSSPTLVTSHAHAAAASLRTIVTSTHRPHTLPTLLPVTRDQWGTRVQRPFRGAVQ
jgi:hypothetical protein